ncbi:uncharacterized protein LOC133831970 [Humulus lupulus]|uniref:uncharacterized protein LOC133831970 n=1 Tax=Humulus lupulus TaxID=3486 RepID=UPI002B404F90|nr:uncharacterized protein LOC133831970 [Humulus lupulus]
MTMGLTMVKFNDDATRDHVLENGILQFDRKPDLGLQYWGSKCLSALVSTIGKPIMVDKFTRERSRIQYARILVEMEVIDNPPRSIQYINEHGQIMEQGVEYEWLPIKCKTYAGFGHSMTDCRKDQKTQWVVKEPTTKTERKDQRTEGIKDVELEKPATQASSGEGKVQVNPVETLQPNSEESAANDKGNQASQPWLTPKRVAAQTKDGQSSEIIAKNSGQKYKKSNKFVVLQEQVLSGKEGNTNSVSSNG